MRVIGGAGECSGSIYLLGGTYVPSTQVVVRFEDFGFMPHVAINTAVICVSGVFAEGFFTGTIDEAMATKAMIDMSQRTIVVADRSKFDILAFARVAELRRVHYLVTDAMPDHALRIALDDAEVEIVICNPNEASRVPADKLS